MSKLILKISSLIVVIIIALTYLNFFSNIVFPSRKDEAIITTLSWGGLNKLPEHIKNLEIEQRGSAFTRKFIIKFSCNEKEIQNWVTNCERLKNNIPKINNKTKVYEIYPGENGAIGGKVEIEETKVLINMSWN
ncbi:MAG TPA: hypothetical protein PLO52_04455 [Flavobacterium alvei]|nr:hypothetical protein [Flavobacterium alvei]HQK39352.1 hypothetical protein [Flavobacterium alvei]